MSSAVGIIRDCLPMLTRGEMWRWGGLVVLALVAALLETMGTGVVFGLISVVADPTSLAKLPLVGGRVAALAAADPDRVVLTMSGVVIVFFVAKTIFMIFLVSYQEETAFTTADRISITLMRGYLHSPYEFHFQRNSSQLIRTLEFSVDDAIRGGLQSIATLMSEGMVSLGLITVLLVSEPKVALISTAFFGMVLVVAFRSTRRAFTRIGVQVQRLGVLVVQAVQQGLGAAKEIKILGREDNFAEAFSVVRVERSLNQRRFSVLSQIPRLATETLLVVGMVLIVALMILDRGDRAVVLPILGLFGYAGFRLLPSVNRMVVQLSGIVKTGASVETLLRDWPDIAAAAARPLTHPAPLPFQDRLSIEDIHYSYPGVDRPVLAGVSLTIARGDSVGIVGTTGAGKSTLIDVILGLLPPTSGRVLVDGTDIAADPRAWQRRIGYVPQTIYLTDDTLRRNIAFGMAETEIDDAQLSEAVAMAQLTDFVASLPAGMDTRVGERGLNLSGGQRQRVGIARALYHQPELLVFDEATSALDPATEMDVARAIDSLIGYKTMIIISHRLSTMSNCDVIFVMKDGRIAGQGRRDELLRNNDEFRRIAGLSESPSSARPGDGTRTV